MKQSGVLLASLLTLCVCLSVLGADATGNEIHLVLVHVNDSHGRLMPREGRDGDAARGATVIRKVRSENPGRTLVLHAGDVFSGGDPLTVHSGGGANLKAMEMMGFDVLTPGNGEFYFGIDNLRKQAAKVRFSVIHANAADRGTNKLLFPPFVIKEIAGLRIGILGIGIVRTWHPSARPLDVRNGIAEAGRYAAGLRKLCDVLVGLTHIGAHQDVALAIAVPHFDIIIGGHSHTALPGPKRVPLGTGDRQTYIAQAGENWQHVGRVDVRLRRSKTGVRVVRVDGRLIPIGKSVKRDPEIAAMLDKAAAPLKRVICRSEVDLPNATKQSSPMGRFTTELLRKAAGADVALLRFGDLQTGITRGPVTLEQVYRIHPWRNRLVRLKMTGAQLTDLVVSKSGARITLAGAPGGPREQCSVVAGDYLAGTNAFLRKLPSTDAGMRTDQAIEQHLRKLRVIRRTAR